MYLKAWCTCRAVVLHIKPILLSLSSLSPSWLPKLRIVEVKTCYAALFTTSGPCKVLTLFHTCGN